MDINWHQMGKISGRHLSQIKIQQKVLRLLIHGSDGTVRSVNAALRALRA